MNDRGGGPGGRMVRIFVSLLSAEMLTRALAVVAVAVVARSLEAGEFGAFSYALALAGVLGIAVDVGLPTLILRDVSAQPRLHAALLGGSLKLQAVLGGLIYGGAAALAGIGLLGGPASASALALAFGALAVGTWGRTFEAVLAAHDLAHLVTLGRVARGLTLICGTAAAALAGGGPEAFLLAWLAGEACGALAAGLLCVTRTSRPRLDSSLPTLRRLFRRAVPFALLAGFGLLYARIDLVMLGQFDTDLAVGNYGVASRIVETAIIVPAYFGSAFLATVAQTGAGTRIGAGQTTQAMRYILLACAPLAFMLALVAEPLVLLFAGGGYGEAPSLLVRLSPMLLLVASYGVLSNLQVALDRLGTLVWINLGGLALKVALNLYAIPAYGAEGAAATAILAETAVVLAQWYTAREHFQVFPLLAWGAKFLLATAAMLAAGLAVLAALPWPPAVVAGLAAFLLIAWLTDCISVAEVRSIHSSLRVGA